MAYRFIVFILLIAAVTVPAHGQQWMTDYISENGFDGDALVAYAGEEMQKSTDSTAVPFSFTVLGEDEPTGIHAFADRPTVVMFWKTTCSGSEMQLKELEKLRGQYAADELKILYVSPQASSELKAYRKNHTVSGTMAHVNKDDLAKPYQTLVTPSLFLLDGSGKVQETWLKPKKAGALKTLAAPLL